ncbi:IS110 family transposase [Candidatus Chloroploca sp. Khr17]|uniref:IS110 family transposase n=1 Tax=Candidatus Chloroploca sp. Khr17 TaxID=2496869 RepID=UPI0013ED16BF|nr:IS110 family transposase [Candidatus Chloroploca sp. Khr17]
MDVLGIDLAKLTFDATVQTATGAHQYQAFPNTPDGFAQLTDWLIRLGVTHVHACMEATNISWEALATWLHARGHTVSVVNPARIKGYAQATMQRNKTDKLDSVIIASFCATHQPTAWEPMSEVRQHLRALVRHRDDLLQTQLQHTNRLRDTTDALVRQSLDAILKVVATQIQEVDQAITAHMKANPELRTNLKLLTSIVGIGTVTAAKLLAEFAAMDQYDSARSAAADTGVTPSQYESGTSVRRRPRMSKMGNANLRSALYWPAITAMTHCPAVKAFAARLAANNKPKKVIIGAVMRKLVHIIYGVLKHQTPYDPAKVLGPSAKQPKPL